VFAILFLFFVLLALLSSLIGGFCPPSLDFAVCQNDAPDNLGITLSFSRFLFGLL
jgi:hypothetical protein